MKIIRDRCGNCCYILPGLVRVWNPEAIYKINALCQMTCFLAPSGRTPISGFARFLRRGFRSDGPQPPKFEPDRPHILERWARQMKALSRLERDKRRYRVKDAALENKRCFWLITIGLAEVRRAKKGFSVATQDHATTASRPIKVRV